MEKIIKIILLFLFILSPIECFAADIPSVIINEIAWMGTTASANDEWIELYNNSDIPINLEGWMLIAEDGAPKDIKLTGSVLAEDFYLLERTDDNSVPNIAADLIYTGALGNNGEVLKLYDNLGNLIDEANCGSGWLAGDNKTKQTMEKTNTGWQTSAEPGGTPNSIVASGQAPKSQNSEGVNPNGQTPTPQNSLSLVAGQAPSPAPSTAPSPPLSPPPAHLSPLPTPSVTHIYPDGITFNEILPSPEGADSENEWVEVFNQNNFEVNLSGWKIKDSEGAVATYSFPEGTKISGLGYLTISREESKITMNNDKDSLSLLQPDGKIADTISYGKAPLGQSYNRNKNSWEWSDSLTPGAQNSITNLSAKTNSQSSTVGAETKQSSGTAALAENLPTAETSQNKNTQTENNLKAYIPAALIALFIAIFSGIAILFLKKKYSPIE